MKLSKWDMTWLSIFLIIYNMSASYIEIGFFSAARWGIAFLLMLFSFVYAAQKNNFCIRLLPKPFLWLIYPLLFQCLWDIDSIDVTLTRSLSFFIYCIAIYSFFNRKHESAVYMQKIYYFFAVFMSAFILLVNLISINNYSIHGDFMGFYPNRNMTVSVLLSALVLFSNYLLNNKVALKKYIFIFYVGIMTYLIFITHSRMAFFCYAVIVLYFFVFVHANKNAIRNIIICMLIPIVAMSLPIIGQVFDIESINRVFERSTSDDSTGLGRDNWEIGINLIAQRPFFGWGANSTYYHTFVASESRWGWGMHNSYLVMLTEGGIVGVIFYVLFFVDIFNRCWKKYNKIYKSMTEKEVVFVKMCFLSCLVLFVNGVSESFLFSAGNLMSLPFWFSLITMYAYLDQKYKER